MARNDLRIDVRSNLRQAVIEFQVRTEKVVAAATLRALNRTATSVRAEGVRRIRERYNLKAGTVRKQLRIDRATRNRLVSAVAASGRPIPLVEFAARQNRRGVSVKVTRQRKTVSGVFIAKMKSGHVGVYKREGKSRLPIRELFSVSLPQTFTQKQILAAMRKTAVERFGIEFTRELRYRTGALNG